VLANPAQRANLDTGRPVLVKATRTVRASCAPVHAKQVSPTKCKRALMQQIEHAKHAPLASLDTTRQVDAAEPWTVCVQRAPHAQMGPTKKRLARQPPIVFAQTARNALMAKRLKRPRAQPLPIALARLAQPLPTATADSHYHVPLERTGLESAP